MLDRVLVTGAGGCLGSWVVRQLVDEGTAVVAFDVSEDYRRLRLLLDEGRMGGVVFRRGDLRDFAAVESLVREENITHIVHLAALQIPFCAADPIMGAQVNVAGTVNILEAVRRSEGRVRGTAYASSVAVFGPAEMYEEATAGDRSPLAPRTLYGVYKQANEGTARVYADDWGVGSVGLRPCIVYGPGRDQGLTSDPTKSMLAAAAGSSSHIGFGGSSTFQHAQDAADCFLAAARLETDSALIHNMGGPTAAIADIAAAVSAAAPGVGVTFDDQPLPLPQAIDGTALDGLLGVRHRTMEEGIADAMGDFRRMLDAGLLQPPR